MPSHAKESQEKHQDRRGREDPPHLRADGVGPPDQGRVGDPRDEQDGPEREVEDCEGAHAFIALTRNSTPFRTLLAKDAYPVRRIGSLAGQTCGIGGPGVGAAAQRASASPIGVEGGPLRKGQISSAMRRQFAVAFRLPSSA